MRIIFDLRNVGLGNNGGSMTVVKSGNTLLDMGHDVYFIDGGKNQHTWTQLKAEHIKVKRKNQIPDADIIIATGYKSVRTTVVTPERCGIKAHWIRGWETWQMSESRIVKEILKAPTLKLVNSICLNNKLKKYGVASKIIRPGYDFNELYPMDKRIGSDVIIGGLYTKGKHSNIKRTRWLFETSTYLKRKYNNIKLWMFGTEVSPTENIDTYFSKPSVEEKCLFYNQIDIWMAPAQQEGLHMPPAEAMMTACPVVSTNAEMSGTQDYVLHKLTGLVSDNNLKSFKKNVEILYKHPYTRKEMGENALNRIEELGSRKQNMQVLIDYIGTIK